MKIKAYLSKKEGMEKSNQLSLTKIHDLKGSYHFFEI